MAVVHLAGFGRSHIFFCIFPLYPFTKMRRTTWQSRKCRYEQHEWFSQLQSSWLSARKPSLHYECKNRNCQRCRGSYIPRPVSKNHFYQFIPSFRVDNHIIIIVCMYLQSLPYMIFILMLKCVIRILSWKLVYQWR